MLLRYNKPERPERIMLRWLAAADIGDGKDLPSIKVLIGMSRPGDARRFPRCDCGMRSAAAMQINAEVS